MVNDIQLQTALRVLSLVTSQRLVTSLAFPWEIASSHPNAIASVVQLSEAGCIDFVARHPTVDEYLAACQASYEFDAQRYPMYFSAIPHELLKCRPTVLKERNTSDVLLSQLNLLSSETQEAPYGLLSGDDRRVLPSMRSGIHSALYEREDQAITLSFFQERLKHDNRIPGELALARFLSLVHLWDYLRFLAADISTGVPGLEYFDRVSRSYPRFDVQFIIKTLETLLGPLSWLHRRNFVDELVACRGTTLHGFFISKLNHILMGICYAAEKNRPGSLLSPTRPELYGILGHLSRTVDPGREISNVTELIKRGGTELDRCILSMKSCYEFAEYTDLLETTAMVRQKVLLLTANPTETKAVISVARQYGLDFTRAPNDAHTYYLLGVLAGAELYIVQSEAGTESPSAATLTAMDAVDYLRPNALIAVGIAFGMKQGEQNLQDILVSKQIRLVDPKKVRSFLGREVVLPRGDRVEASGTLLDRFRSGLLDWEGCKVHFGLILSSNTLVNSRSSVRKLRRIEPEADGGEMEGAGLYCVGAKRKVDWILVKGISDWGIGKTDEHREKAALNATKYVFHVISCGGFLPAAPR